MSNKAAQAHQAVHQRFRNGRALLKESVIPGTLHYGRKGKAVYHNRLVPGLKRISRPVKSELIKIHRKQNLLGKVRTTLIHKGLGLYLAMLSASFVGTFIEVRSANNLWGLFPQGHLVSETTFTIACFAVEFIVALCVFTLTEHYLDELRAWQQRRTQKR